MGETQPLFDMSKAQPIPAPGAVAAPIFDMSKATPIGTAGDKRSAAGAIPPPGLTVGAPPSRQATAASMHPSFLIGDPDADATPHSLGDAARGVLRNVYQVNPLGIAVSIAHDKAPGVVSKIPLVGAAMERNAAPLERLPIQAAENFTMMALPGAEGDAGEVVPEAASREVAPVAQRAPSSAPGVVSRLRSLGVREMRSHIPFFGRSVAKPTMEDLTEAIRGPQPEAPAPAIPSTNGIPWGSGGQGPIALRGKMMLPQDPGVFPGAPLPETPDPELLQANALTEGGSAPTEPGAALGRIPPPQLPESVPPSIVRRPGEIPPMMVRPRAVSPRNVEPIPPRSGLLLPAPAAGSMVRSIETPAPETPAPESSWPPDLSRAIEQRPIPGSPEDAAETRAIQEQIRDAAEAEDATRLAREKAEWFRRNTVQATKGDLIANIKPTASSSSPEAVPAEGDLTGILKKSLAAAKKAKALKAGKPGD